MRLLSILLVISLWCQPLVAFASIKSTSHNCCTKTEKVIKKEVKHGCCSKGKKEDTKAKKGCCKSDKITKNTQTDKKKESKDCCGDECQCIGCLHHNNLTSNAIWNTTTPEDQITIGYIIKNQFNYADFISMDQNKMIYHPPKV